MTLQNDPPSLESVSEYEDQYKSYGKSVRKLIVECLQKDPTKRPTASELLKHPFIKKAKDRRYLMQTLLPSTPSLAERARKAMEAKRLSGFDSGSNGESGSWVWPAAEDGVQRLDDIFEKPEMIPTGFSQEATAAAIQQQLAQQQQQLALQNQQLQQQQLSQHQPQIPPPPPPPSSAATESQSSGSGPTSANSTTEGVGSSSSCNDGCSFVSGSQIISSSLLYRQSQQQHISSIVSEQQQQISQQIQQIQQQLDHQQKLLQQSQQSQSQQSTILTEKLSQTQQQQADQYLDAQQQQQVLVAAENEQELGPKLGPATTEQQPRQIAATMDAAIPPSTCKQIIELQKQADVAPPPRPPEPDGVNSRMSAVETEKPDANPTTLLEEAIAPSPSAARDMVTTFADGKTDDCSKLLK